MYAASTSSSASASTSAVAVDLIGEYEVFLSFCGKDTRNGFTDFLYTYLDGTGIRTFRDDNGLRVGEEIGPELLKAIKDSKISIPIFSKNYASSKWCLLELAQMVECQTNGGQIIIPIFYDVDPWDVRHQSGHYDEAFRQYRKKRLDEKTVEGWKQALTKVGQLKGLELKKETGGREGELVKITVERILEILKKNHKHEIKNLVGMDKHIENMEGLLKVDSDCVRVIGIHGMGGLGKTTIAKIIYNRLDEHFECKYFLEDVREISKSRDGMVHLQNQVLSNTGKRKVSNIDGGNERITKIKDAVHRKKVLIVLDDVDEMSQMDNLIGSYKWFAAGSRIIITTRNEEVLRAFEHNCHREGHPEVYRNYKPGLMDDEDSLQLFSKYAFMSDSPPTGYDILSKEVVSAASGLPLVLVTIGSSLFGEKDTYLWEEKLRKLKEIPDKKVLDRLRLSFDPLDYGQKQIFLDIACFFIGEDKGNPCYMWEDCKFYPRDGLNVLVRRSLITIGDDNTLRMHDQLRDLGREFVRQGNSNEPWRWSRLWRNDEALATLQTRQGTENVKGLRVDRGWHRKCLVEEDFRKLPNLWYLNLFDMVLDGDFKDCLPNLRWLQLRGYYCNFAPRNLLLNLVILDISLSNITDDWEGWSLIKRSKKLKVLNIYRCRNLSRVPYLSTFWMLERLDVRKCGSLSSLDGIEGLEMLRYLDASSCRSLERLPNLSKLSKLEELSVSDCGKLVEIQGLEKLESLEVLSMSFCYHLKGLPNLSNLKRLKTLNVASCKLLLEIPVLTGLESLEHLNMSYVSTERLPDLSNLKRLRELDASSCYRLMEIQGVEGLESLEHLYLSNCTSIKRLPVLSNLKSLKSLDVSFCDTLIEIPGLEERESLELLHIVGCKSIEKSPDFQILRN